MTAGDKIAMTVFGGFGLWCCLMIIFYKPNDKDD